jgi:hypothetical protein
MTFEKDENTHDKLFVFPVALRPNAGHFLFILEVSRSHSTPLDEWSACYRDPYLTTHNTHNKETSMSLAGFEFSISVGERPQTYAVHRAATGTGMESVLDLLFIISGQSPSDLCAIVSQYCYEILKYDIIPSPIMARKLERLSYRIVNEKDFYRVRQLDDQPVLYYGDSRFDIWPRLGILPFASCNFTYSSRKNLGCLTTRHDRCICAVLIPA